MLQRLFSLAAAAQQQLQQQQVLPLLQQLVQQQQQQQIPSLAAVVQSPHAVSVPSPLATQWQPTASYSQRANRLNPKEQKRQSKTDKRALKKSAVPQSSASASDSSTSFAEEVQAMEADVTKLVLQAIHNVTPVLDVRTIRSSTQVKYIPGLMPPKKARSLALHWLYKAAAGRADSSKAGFAECLALELLLAYQKKGTARQKRDDIHKLALQNRANVHMRWW